MFIENVHTTTDFMNALAQTIETGEQYDFELLRQKVQGWMQPQEETDAMVALIEAASAMCEENEGNE